MTQLFIAAIFYIFSILLIFWQPLFAKFGSIQWDAVTVHFLNLFFSSEIWHNGIFPLWSPYIFAGFPQIADLQVAFFYPINFIIGIFTVFTPEIMMHQTILHYFLAGFFAFLLAKHLSKNFWFSLSAGLVYSFGGFMAGHASHVGMQNTATWIPLIFLFLIIALEKEKIFYAALSGLFLSFAILAGHFQITLYIAYAIAFYFIFDIAWIIAGSIKTIDKKLIDSVLNKTKIASVIFIIAFLVSAIQLLPAYELTLLSNRAKISLEMSQTESLKPSSLKSLIEPNYNNASYGSPYSGPWDRTQNYLYLGNAIIILAFLGLIVGIFYQSARKITLFWLMLLLISLFYSFGEFSFLQKYFFRFAPFFDKIRAPANMMILFNLSIIGLASSFFKNIDKLFPEIENPNMASASLSAKKLLRSFEKVFLKNISVFLGISALLIIFLEILPAVRLNTLLYSRQKANEVIAAPPIADRIIQEYDQLNEIDKFRIFKVPGLDRNLTQMLHIFAFDGYNPLSLKRYNNYIDAMVKNEKLVDLAAIKYIPCEFISNRSSKLEKIGPLCINKNYSRLAFFADNFAVAENEEAALQKIQETDLKNIVILEEAPAQNTGNENSSKDNPLNKTSKVSITEFKTDFRRFSAITDNDSFLFISQANYPGWIAKIDGIPAKIYQADYLFQAVFVPKGEHEITLKFESRPLIIGAILAIIGMLSVFLIALNAIRQKKFKKRFKITKKHKTH